MTNRTSRIEQLLSIRNMDQDEVIRVLRRKNLLKQTMKCPHCSLEMLTRERSGHTDKYAWVCNNTVCEKIKTTVNIRKWVFFDFFV